MVDHRGLTSGRYLAAPDPLGIAGRICLQLGAGRSAEWRFYFFFIEIWPQEFYFVAGLLIMAGFGCSCSPPRSAGLRAAIPARRPSGPTFIPAERWIEGDRNARVRLWNASTAAKVRPARSSGTVCL